MKNSAKHSKDQNSLELLLRRMGEDYQKNKDRILWGVLVFLVVFFGILFFRNYQTGGNQKTLTQLDDAYYLSTEQSIPMAATAPNPLPWEDLTRSFTKGDNGALVRICLGEARLKTAQTEIAQKYYNSKAPYNDEQVAALDPAATLASAQKTFDEVINASMAKAPLLDSRALFGSAATFEYLASIAADETQVAENLEKAKARYQEAIDASADSPYAAPAKNRIAELDRPVSLTYYKDSAKRFVNLPVPPAKPEGESILSGDPAAATDAPAPGEKKEFGILNELPKTDEVAAPAPETAPTENAAPAPEATPAENAAPAPEATPTENAAPSEPEKK